MNKCILIGRLVVDPEARTTPNGTAASRYRLAVDRQGRSEETDFLNCVAFGKGAEFANRYLHKGMKVAVEGRIQTGSYEKDGVRHYTTEIIVERHEFCESRNAATAAPAAAPTYEAPQVIRHEPLAPAFNAEDFTPISGDDDLPF